MNKTKQKDTTIIVSRIVEAYLSNQRKSKAKTKTRGEVSGGGKKPFRQKGTGRARAGSNRSPIWKGGGVVFGPIGQENYKKKVNKKEKEFAKKTALDVRKDQTISIDVPKITKTKEAAELLKKHNLVSPTLIIATNLLDKATKSNLAKIFKNIPKVKFAMESQVNTFDILKAKSIILLKNTSTSKKEASVKKAGKK